MNDIFSENSQFLAYPLVLILVGNAIVIIVDQLPIMASKV
jgi:hypothetical protein